jgi:hypothetical protein
MDRDIENCEGIANDLHVCHATGTNRKMSLDHSVLNWGQSPLHVAFEFVVGQVNRATGKGFESVIVA